jgi:hypothetical protein
MADHLSKIDNGEPPTGGNNQLPNANLFCIEVLEGEDDYMEENERGSEEDAREEEIDTPCLE